MANDDDWQREMERYLAHFKRAGKRPTILFAHHGQTSPVWAPALDMYETDEAFVVLLDIAGVRWARVAHGVCAWSSTLIGTWRGKRFGRVISSRPSR